MKQKLLTDHLLGVVVPKGSHEFQIGDVDHENKHTWIYFYNSRPLSIDLIYDPIKDFSDYEIIGLSSSITEEQAKGLVQSDEQGKYFEDYQVVRGDRFTALTAKESLGSLIQSCNLIVTPEEDVLLIKIN